MHEQHPTPDAPHPARDAAGDLHAAIGLETYETLQAILERLRARTGHDFRQYKPPTVLRRIDRRMQVRRVRDLRAYLDLLDDEPDEATRLFQELLIGVTSFFRDRPDFAALEQTIVPRLFDGKRSGEELRAWVTACSTGEEAYSLALLLHAHAARLSAPPRLQLFATDVDARAIQTARAGVYPATIAQDVPPALLERYSALDGDRYVLAPALRESLLFAEHNLLSDPPFSRLDLVTCRNLLIYLNRDHHRRVLELFHFALRPGGYLFLGSAESAETAADLFDPVDARHCLYQARPCARGVRATRATDAAAPLPRPFLAQPAAPARAAGPAPAWAEIHRAGALQAAPPSILVDRDGAILHIGDDAGRFLRHAGGEPSRDLVALVPPALRLELRTALFRARASGQPAATAHMRHDEGGTPGALTITVRPLADADADGVLLVQFHALEGCPGPAAEADGADRARLRQLESELRETRRKLQETMDHADAARTESKIANEWLQSTLAQLRAALEEQRTGQEELQSANEEMMTVNTQLRLKVDETAKAHDDLSNLIASTDIATIFLDGAMRIKRYTPRVRDVFNVIPTDVGRPLTHLAGRLDYPQLAADVESVLASLDPLEREVPGAGGQFYIARIHPYRTTGDRIDGAVLTFFDITRRRAAEQALRRSEEHHRAELERQVRERTAELEANRDLLQATMDSSMDMIQVFEAVRDADGTIVDFRWALNNHTSESRYGEVRGQSLLERNPGVVREGIFATFCRVVETGVAQQDERHYPHEQFDGWFLQSVVKLGDGVATTTKDITDWKRAQAEVLRLRDEVAQARLLESQRALRVSERHLELAMAAAGMYSWDIDVAARRLTFSSNTNALLGIELDDGSPDLLARVDALLAPHERTAKHTARERAMRGEAEFHELTSFIDPDSGAPVWVETHGTPIFGPGGVPERVVGVGFNITERKRAEEALRSSEARHAFLLELADALRPLDDADEIVYTAARVLGEHLGTDRAYYVDIDEARQEFVVARDWHRPGETSHARRYPLAAWTMPWLDDGATWVVRDVDTDQVLPDEQRPSYRANGIRAAVVVPLIKGGRLVATFVTNARQPRAWTATEVALIEDTAERIWAAVERSKAHAALCGAGERHALLLQSMEDGVLGVAQDGRCNFVNTAGAALLGLAPDAVIGRLAADLLHPAGPSGGERPLPRALADGVAARIGHEVLRRGDGSALAVSCRVSPLLADGRAAGTVIVFRAPDGADGTK